LLVEVTVERRVVVVMKGDERGDESDERGDV